MAPVPLVGFAADGRVLGRAVKELDAAYDKWWDEVLPCLENEDAVGPAVNPFKELYWKQFGGGPGEKTETDSPQRTQRKNRKD